VLNCDKSGIRCIKGYQAENNGMLQVYNPGYKGHVSLFFIEAKGNTFSFSSFHEPYKCALFSGYNLPNSGYNFHYNHFGLRGSFVLYFEAIGNFLNSVFQYFYFYFYYSKSVNIDKCFKHGFGLIGPTEAEIWPVKELSKNEGMKHGWTFHEPYKCAIFFQSLNFGM
jgi:hypothetical protein